MTPFPQPSDQDIRTCTLPVGFRISLVWFGFLPGQDRAQPENCCANGDQERGSIWFFQKITTILFKPSNSWTLL
ncbi:MAG TPA: hypothetical protein DEF45_24060 [Rhodopirellula sp.]|nr:hypothetical protein [Rhodopirellula sp.]